MIREAAGKLGKLGKHIEVSGKIPGTDLEETLALEVYDDFPNLALLSLSLRNSGNSDVTLDSVTLQRHSFDASLTAPGASPHNLWTFQGSEPEVGQGRNLPNAREVLSGKSLRRASGNER